MLPIDHDDQLIAKRAVAICAVEKLLRVCADHENEAWLSNYRNISQALRRQCDEDAIAFAEKARLENLSLLEPRWVVSERLAEDVRKSIARLRTHRRYGDQRPPLTISNDVPDVEAEGTRVQRFQGLRLQRLAAQFAESVQQDPIEDDPTHTPREAAFFTTWLLLADGAPPESTTYEGLPGPTDFFCLLFAELCGTTELPHITEERHERADGPIEVVTGFCGTKEVGYRFVNRWLDTVAFDITVETYGLPGMEVHWHFVDQFYHPSGASVFRHVSLKARFDDAKAEGLFTQVWRKVFKTIPRWETAAGPRR